MHTRSGSKRTRAQTTESGYRFRTLEEGRPRRRQMRVGDVRHTQETRSRGGDSPVDHQSKECERLDPDRVFSTAVAAEDPTISTEGVVGRGDRPEGGVHPHAPIAGGQTLHDGAPRRGVLSVPGVDVRPELRSKGVAAADGAHHPWELSSGSTWTTSCSSPRTNAGASNGARFW